MTSILLLGGGESLSSSLLWPGCDREMLVLEKVSSHCSRREGCALCEMIKKSDLHMHCILCSYNYFYAVYPLPGCEDFLSSLCELPLGEEVGGSDKQTFISSSNGHRQKCWLETFSHNSCHHTYHSIMHSKEETFFTGGVVDPFPLKGLLDPRTADPLSSLRGILWIQKYLALCHLHTGKNNISNFKIGSPHFHGPHHNRHLAGRYRPL